MERDADIRVAEFPSKLKEILEDPKIYKLGVNVIGDAQKLVRDYGNVYTRGILDLSDIARTVDAENCKPGSSKIALAKLCEQYIGCELDKGAVRTSNWSHRLTGAQMDCESLRGKRNAIN
jgi:ribonuclease D